MYLKNIEIHGFKSFARKIVFDFHEGITGIVGPNGSGKSNVADAVRWVFGEQKVKQLRGGSMQDVIFSGTELRKPLSYAAVSITLDNSDHQLAIDFEEVTITRKLFRSGESEYAINGSTCRLKDINELFYDTGIGKEGYSIIGQGQIDKILSGKPEERRELFDEAAGIVKFKKRKNISVKKLEDERQNLIRLNDILSEIEKRVGPLERQSKVAKEYLDKKQSLKVYDINMFLLETEKIKNQIKEVEQHIGIVQNDYQNSNQRYEAMKEEYEEAEDEIEEINVELERLKKYSNDTNILKQQLEGKIAVLNEQINAVKMSDEHIANRVISIQSDMMTREKNKNELEVELGEIADTLKTENEKANIAKRELDRIQTNIQDTSLDAEAKKKEIIENLNNRASTKARIQRFDTMLEQGQIRKSQIHRRLIEIETEKVEYKNQLNARLEEQKVVEEQANTFYNNMHNTEARIQEMQNLLAVKENQLRNGQTEYHREQSRLDSLKNITERYDGYGNSIRRVMEKKAQEPGLLGVVADIIKTEKKYEIAIETALGGSIQNIVTDNENTAKKMVQYLKQNKFGRATFLPLTSMRGSQGFKNNEALRESGVIGVASSLVHVEQNYEKLADNLLGRTIVVQNIDIGIGLGRKYHNSLRIVTLEGELLNPGGSITGGAFKNTSNLLGRRREIEQLEEHVLSLRQNMNTLECEINQEKETRNQYYSDLDQFKIDLQDVSVKQNTSKLQVSQLRNKIEEIEQTYKEILSENSELENQNINITGSIQEIQEELRTSEEIEQSTTHMIQELNVKIEELRVLEVEALKENEEIHLSVASAKQKYDFINENYTRITNELLIFQEELTGLDQNKDHATQEIQEKMHEIEEIQNSIVESKELFEEIEVEIQKQLQSKEEMTKKHKALLSKREEVSKQIFELDKELLRLSNKQESLEEASEKSINYMWEEYEITYNYALELRDPAMIDLEFMRREIKELKTQIKALGTVNVNAIEEFKEVSERYIFLKTQHDDLIEAERTLLEIIDELDAAMREQFKNQFTLISEEYDKVFKQLFGGGKGTIELMEHEDILEAGIRIVAQPPGKKLQNMMQLSGGEKALTAISLLFAIQNLKPSPFCLLDEIEAALDDSNVVRFAKYLHKLTKNTQFIVITHRRGTMTSADRLYGITMQEKGVSTLVSVDLLQDELEKQEQQATINS